jgi:hypothetical protein
MKQENKNQLFRLAAVLYADNNYDVVPKTIHKKIVESVLLECNSKELSTHQIIDYVDKQYKITLDEEAIIGIIKENKNDSFHFHYNNGDIFVCLSEKRKISLNEKISHKNINYFIDEFQNIFTNLVKNVKYKEILYRFLYDLFSTNTQSFQKLIDNKKDLSGLINLESSSYNTKEKEIINSFLLWDNVDKNKAIFDISSYALEYCMLTNKNGSTSFQLVNLKNKSFYLDTNIIYRTLGINGENRKNRSRTFLKKFCDSGEKLIISKSTDDEFRDGIRGHVDRIRKYDSPRVNSQLFQEVDIQKEIYSFYHNWRVNKVNTSLELFLAEIFSRYDDFKSEYKIELDTIIPFDLKDKEVDTLIKDYTTSISTFKSKEGNEMIGSAMIDAENIFWIEKKRNGKNQNIFETNVFFISTDQSLRRWDYQRNNHTPIVLLPSQWMSIILRYFDCTSDDYSSFVNFLNLKNNEILIDSEKLHIVLAGISEMTESLDQQRTILHNLIDNKFNGVISKGTSFEQIFENSKKYAKTELEKQVEELKLQNEENELKHKDLKAEFYTHKEITTKEISDLKLKSKNHIGIFTNIEIENNELKLKLQEIYITNKISKWRKEGIWALILIFLILIFIYLLIFATDWQYNYVQQLINFIDKNPSDSIKAALRFILTALLLGSSIPSLIFCYKRYISKDEKYEKIKKIKEQMPAKYK